MEYENKQANNSCVRNSVIDIIFNSMFWVTIKHDGTQQCHRPLKQCVVEEQYTNTFWNQIVNMLSLLLNHIYKNRNTIALYH